MAGGRVGGERLVELAQQEQRLASQVMQRRIIRAKPQSSVEHGNRLAEALLPHQSQTGAAPIRIMHFPPAPVPLGRFPVLPALRHAGTAAATTRSRLSARMAKP